MTDATDMAQWIADLIRNEYDKAPDYYKSGDNWDDGADSIAAKILEQQAAAHEALVMANRELAARLGAHCACEWNDGKLDQCVLHAGTERALFEAQAHIAELTREWREHQATCVEQPVSHKAKP